MLIIDVYFKRYFLLNINNNLHSTSPTNSLISTIVINLIFIPDSSVFVEKIAISDYHVIIKTLIISMFTYIIIYEIGIL